MPKSEADPPMPTDPELPEWAMEEAAKRLRPAYATLWSCGTWSATCYSVAMGLVEAYRAGHDAGVLLADSLRRWR